jgi:hypothetical protein
MSAPVTALENTEFLAKFSNRNRVSLMKLDDDPYINTAGKKLIFPDAPIVVFVRFRRGFQCCNPHAHFADVAQQVVTRRNFLNNWPAFLPETRYGSSRFEKFSPRLFRENLDPVAARALGFQ